MSRLTACFAFGLLVAACAAPPPREDAVPGTVTRGSAPVRVTASVAASRPSLAPSSAAQPTARPPETPRPVATPTPAPTPPPVSDIVDAPLPGKAVWQADTELVGAGNLHQVVHQDGDTFTWYLVGQTTYECTVSPTITVENMTVSPHAPVQVVPAGRTVRVLSYTIADKRKSYRNHLSFSAQLGDFRASPAPYVYALPWAATTPYPIGQGWHGKYSHTGEGEYAVDIGLPEGTTVRAARDGTVTALNATATSGGTTAEFDDRKLANFIFVRHEDATYAKYWHLAPGGVLATVGQVVHRGDVIGKSGNTGRSSGPHLHFEVGAPIDGTHSRSFPFHWLVDPAQPDGAEPVEGTDYLPP